MSNIIISPSKYIQGKGELNNLGIHVNKLGKKSLILV
ncbi:MAG: glycerol dehydrogenase, partial [Clostridium sp.]|nr:glycerol dehydrogenase [Clostridium sp.]